MIGEGVVFGASKIYDLGSDGWPWSITGRKQLGWERMARMGAKKVSVLGDVARSCCEWLTGCRIGGNRWLEVGPGTCSNL